MKINVSRICLKRVTGMKTFQMRMKIKVETNEINASRLCLKKRHRNESIPNAEENKSKNY